MCTLLIISLFTVSAGNDDLTSNDFSSDISGFIKGSAGAVYGTSQIVTYGKTDAAAIVLIIGEDDYKNV